VNTPLIVGKKLSKALRDTLGHFTFWISPSLSGIAERTHRPQGGIILEYLRVLKIFIIIIIDKFSRPHTDWDFHWENVLNFHGRKNRGHFERPDAINTFIFSEILPACAKEYLTAATYTVKLK